MAVLGLTASPADGKRPSAGARYREQAARRAALVALTGVALVVSVISDAAIGPGGFPLGDVLSAIVRPGSRGVTLDVIVWDIRLPVALMAVLVGAMLGIAGAEMQTILDNPLADPFTLGVSSAASFGASLAIVMGIALVPGVGPFLVTANAFVFALLTSGVLLILTKMRGVTVETMVLVGIALLFTFNALLAFMEYGASETQLQQVVFWIMGSLARASWNKIGICLALLAIALPFCMTRNWSLTALRMGDEKAASLGVDVSRLRVEMLVCTSILAATAVSFVGVVGFVGLVGPHIARLMVGEDQRFFLPCSALAGALLLSVTSIVSKTITPGVIYPISIITSLVGIPFFLSLVFSVRRGVIR